MADGTVQLGGIQSDGTPVDRYGQEMTSVQPEAVLELIAYTVLNPQFDATNEINYLVNQGISQEQINQQLVPLVAQGRLELGEAKALGRAGGGVHGALPAAQWAAGL